MVIGKGHPSTVLGRIAFHVIRIASRKASAQGLQPIARYHGIHQIAIIDAQGVRCHLGVADKFGDVPHVVVFHALVHDHPRTGSPGQSVQPVITIGERIGRGRFVSPQLLRDIPVVLRRNGIGIKILPIFQLKRHWGNPTILIIIFILYYFNYYF